MSIEQPYFCDRFTSEDYKTVALLRRSFHHNVGVQGSHYEPVLLNPGGTYWKADQRQGLGSSGIYQDRNFGWFDFRTARWKFAEVVYSMALERTHTRFPKLGEIHWSDLLPNWRQLTLPECFSEAGDFMTAEIVRITRSGEVSIETGCSLKIAPENRWNRSEKDRTTLHVIMDVEKLFDEITRPFWRSNPTQIYDDLAPRITISFGWEQINGFLYRPTPRQVELINHWDAKPRFKEIDLQLIERVGRLDYDGVEELIRQGANVNGCDEMGDTPINAAAKALAHDHIPFGDDYEERVKAIPEFRPEERIQMIKLLIEHGADVNLSFYEEDYPLLAATRMSDLETVQFLLEAGADPNRNAYPEDDPFVEISTALDSAGCAAHIHGGDEHGDAGNTIYELLEKYGAV